MPYAAGPPPSVHPSAIACFARPVASGQHAGLVRDAVPVHLHPSIQRRAPGRRRSPHRPPGQAAQVHACVRARSQSQLAGGTAKRRAGGSKACARRVGTVPSCKRTQARAVHDVSSERRLLAGGRPPHWPRRGARAVGTSGRAAPSLVQAKGRGDVARPLPMHMHALADGRWPARALRLR